MRDEKCYVKVGNGEYSPSLNERKNTSPIELLICCDSRRDDCKYYVKVCVNTEHVSFYQGFCGFSSRK